MNKPVFSIASASRRNKNYKWFYDTVAKDIDVPFEIVFVGPNPPLEPMPDNFKHIYSTATPCQCTEIAVRNATGEYVLTMGDDCQLSYEFLDKLHLYVQRFDRDKVLVGFRFYLNKTAVFGDNGLMANCDVMASPIIGVGPAFKRDLWIKLGGLDKRFHSSLCDIDMMMRFYEHGFRPFIAPDCFITEVFKDDGQFKEAGWNKPGHPNCSLLYNNYQTARLLLSSFWENECKTRLSPVEPFTEEELQT